jgi:flagellar basal-body rod modification protein FlgD
MATTTTLTGAEAREQFMHLLVTQLQNQNPLEPTSQEDFLQQLSTFSMVEGIESLNASFDQMLKAQELTQGAQLIGKTVEFASNDGTSKGVVQSARVVDGSIVLSVNGKSVPLSDVFAVTQPAA